MASAVSARGASAPGWRRASSTRDLPSGVSSARLAARAVRAGDAGAAAGGTLVIGGVLITGSITLVAEARELLGAPSAGAPGPGTPEAVAVPTAVDVFNDFGLELGDGLDEDEEDFDDIFDETDDETDDDVEGGTHGPEGARGSRADGGNNA